MARLPRLSIGGLPHLLVQRAAHGQPAFVDDADRVRFREQLGEAARAEGVTVHAYALLPGELRLLATPGTAEALGRVMQVLGRRYGAAFNRRHGRTGSLWSGRFLATVLDPEQHLLEAMRFVEDAAPWGGAADLDDGAGTSRGHHLGRRHDPLVHDHARFWALGNTPFEREAAYRRLLEDGLSPQRVAALEGAVRTGWPVGGADFVARLAQQTTRRLVARKAGRPRKVA